MGIDLQWEGERGNVLGRVSDELGLVEELVGTAKDGNTFCLRFIDSYGDTVFNQQQILVLLEELRAMPEDCLTSAAKLQREKLVELAMRAQGNTHTYLKFYGD